MAITGLKPVVTKVAVGKSVAILVCRVMVSAALSSLKVRSKDKASPMHSSTLAVSINVPFITLIIPPLFILGGTLPAQFIIRI